LTNIEHARKRIDNNEPWRPSHSLSKWSNKYTHCMGLGLRVVEYKKRKK